MRNLSRKINKKKYGGQCNQEVKQSYDYHLKKIGNILDPTGLEKKITTQLHNNLSSINKHLENSSLVNVRKLKTLFNDNTDEKNRF